MLVNREGRKDDKRENEDRDVVNKLYYIKKMDDEKREEEEYGD